MFIVNSRSTKQISIPGIIIQPSFDYMKTIIYITEKAQMVLKTFYDRRE